jgi:peptidoglycan/xylan/chitin deacetylase (PgdA/CDA1 family)
MIEAGWEIANHGRKWMSIRICRKTKSGGIQDAIHIHKDATGERPLGWYTGRCSMNTQRLIRQEGGFLYSSDSYADELPYWVEKHLVIPYTLDANDMRFAMAQGFNTGEHFFQYLKDSFDCL